MAAAGRASARDDMVRLVNRTTGMDGFGRDAMRVVQRAVLIEEVGFDFTGADCSGWMSDAGFSRSYVEHLAGHDSMVVGIK